MNGKYLGESIPENYNKTLTDYGFQGEFDKIRYYEVFDLALERLGQCVVIYQSQNQQTFSAKLESQFAGIGFKTWFDAANKIIEKIIEEL